MKGRYARMLKKFTLKNFKNFKDEISIDFQNVAGFQFSSDCITDGVISKMLIYGRNATGKTNLGVALMDITMLMSSMKMLMPNGVFLNADSTEQTAVFSYTFLFGGRELIYKYSRMSNQELQNEQLTIDGIDIFKCDFAKRKYDFTNLQYIEAEIANTDRYLHSLEADEELEDANEARLPFLRWVINNVALKNDSVLIQMANYVQGMVRITVGSSLRGFPKIIYDSFHELLENPKRLKEFEEFLNVMGIACRLVLRKLPDGQRQLYFAHEKLIPFFENASSGTMALVTLYRRVISRLREASLVYLDEFDAFYHYEMAENLIRFFKKRYPKCQIIMTSHNTNLMTNRLMRPDCLFILSRMGTLTSLCDATPRELREGHNLEKMYISGEFEQYE